jgi:hypothetical protein
MAKKTKRKMRFFNGRTMANRFHGYIAAYTKKQAVELGQEAFGSFTMNELNTYWSEAWGVYMDDIKPTVTEPGVWMVHEGFARVWKFVRKAD